MHRKGRDSNGNIQKIRLVVGFLTRFLELVAAFDVITSCIRELDYHQSAVQGSAGVQFHEAAYL